MHELDTNLVSIIMPCLNGSLTIHQAIQSVLLQEHKSVELIIIDDGSTDDSVKIISDYQSADARVKLIINRGTRGVSFARNLGLLSANGNYIAFLDSDDYLLPHSIASRLSSAYRNSANVVYGPYLRLLPDGRLSKVTPPDKISFKDMLRKNYVGNLTGMYRREYFGEVLQSNIRHEDYLMWCNLIKKVDFAYSTGIEPIAVYRVSNSSLSGNKVKAFVWHWMVLRRGLGLSVLKAFYLQAWYFSYSIVERLSIKSRDGLSDD